MSNTTVEMNKTLNEAEKQEVEGYEVLCEGCMEEDLKMTKEELDREVILEEEKLKRLKEEMEGLREEMKEKMKQIEELEEVLISVYEEVADVVDNQKELETKKRKREAAELFFSDKKQKV